MVNRTSINPSFFSTQDDLYYTQTNLCRHGEPIKCRVCFFVRTIRGSVRFEVTEEKAAWS